LPVRTHALLRLNGPLCREGRMRGMAGEVAMRLCHVLSTSLCAPLVLACSGLSENPLGPDTGADGASLDATVIDTGQAGPGDGKISRDVVPEGAAPHDTIGRDGADGALDDATSAPFGTERSSVRCGRGRSRSERGRGLGRFRLGRVRERLPHVCRWLCAERCAQLRLVRPRLHGAPSRDRSRIVRPVRALLLRPLGVHPWLGSLQHGR
jgi:hypothetical protein